MRADAETVFRYVVETYRECWDLRWLAPLGFENTYAMAVRRETAERFGLRTLSDLAREGAQLRAGFTPDFIGPLGWSSGVAHGVRLRAGRDSSNAPVDQVRCPHRLRR